MSNDIILNVEKRDMLGKKVKALRKEGLTPAVIHDRGKDSVHVSLTEAELKKAFASAGKHHPIKLNLDGKKYTTLIKEVVHAPASSSILHTVFQALKEDEKVTAEIPLKLVGDIPAEQKSLLVLKNIEHIVVEAFPKDLLDVIEVDASVLEEVGDKIHVSDIKIPSEVTLKSEADQVIVSVEMPKDQIAEADAALAEQAEQEGATEEAEESAEGQESAETSGEVGDQKAPPAENNK